MEWIKLTTENIPTAKEVLAVNKKQDYLLGYVAENSTSDTGFCCESSHEYLDQVTHYLIPEPPKS